jgi:hypothetical protein
MARYKFQSVSRDALGNIVPSATVSVVLNPGGAQANLYTASVGGVAVHSVTSASDGSYYFYLDHSEYTISQLFDITISKTGYTTQTITGLTLIPLYASSVGEALIALTSTASVLSYLGAVTNVTGTLPITVATGTTTPVIAINAATEALPGSMSAADKTILDNWGTNAVPGAIGETTPSTIRSKNVEIFKTASGDSPLTAAQCCGTVVSNYGMTDADCAISLPTAVAGYSFVLVLPAVRARYFKLRADTSDKIYLSGVAGSDNGYVGVASGYLTASSATFFTFKASDGGYDWFCLPIYGTWIAS